MDNLEYNDIFQQYHRNLVSYCGEIVYVREVFENKEVRIQYLRNRNVATVPFSRERFSVIKARLGMVNILDSVVYVTRLPVRKMGIGLNKDNVRAVSLNTPYPHGRNDTIFELLALTDVGLYKTLTNNFPTFSTAIEATTAPHLPTVAFDRQFAVAADRTIHYKTHPVGMVPKGKTDVSNIVFLKPYKHLSILLDNNHEQTIRHSCTA